MPYSPQATAPVKQEHPNATLILVLGIVVPLVGWIMGHMAKKEIDNGAPYKWEGNLKMGWLIGKILTILGLVGTVLYVILMVIAVVATMNS